MPIITEVTDFSSSTALHSALTPREKPQRAFIRREFTPAEPLRDVMGNTECNYQPLSFEEFYKLFLKAKNKNIDDFNALILTNIKAFNFSYLKKAFRFFAHDDLEILVSVINYLYMEYPEFKYQIIHTLKQDKYQILRNASLSRTEENYLLAGIFTFELQDIIEGVYDNEIDNEITAAAEFKHLELMFKYIYKKPILLQALLQSLKADNTDIEERLSEQNYTILSNAFKVDPSFDLKIISPFVSEKFLREVTAYFTRLSECEIQLP